MSILEPGPASPCSRHPGEEAGQVCQRCGDFICDACVEAAQGALYCEACVNVAGLGLPPGVRWELSALLSRALTVSRACFLPLLLLQALPALCGFLIALGVGAVIAVLVGTQAIGEIGVGIVVLVLGVPMAVLAIWVTMRSIAATIHIVRASLYGEEIPGVFRAFGMGAGRVLPLVGTYLLISVAFVGLACVGLGPFALGAISEPLALIGLPTALMAFVVAIFLTVRWVMIFPSVVVLEGGSGSQALGRAWQLVRGHSWETFAALVIVVVLSMLFAVPGSILQGIGSVADSMVLSLLGMLLGQALGIVFQVYWQTLLVCLYFGLRHSEATRSR